MPARARQLLGARLTRQRRPAPPPLPQSPGTAPAWELLLFSLLGALLVSLVLRRRTRRSWSRSAGGGIASARRVRQFVRAEFDKISAADARAEFEKISAADARAEFGNAGTEFGKASAADVSPPPGPDRAEPAQATPAVAEPTCDVLSPQLPFPWSPPTVADVEEDSEEEYLRGYVTRRSAVGATPSPQSPSRLTARSHSSGYLGSPYKTAASAEAVDDAGDAGDAAAIEAEAAQAETQAKAAQADAAPVHARVFAFRHIFSFGGKASFPPVYSCEETGECARIVDAF
ncbi:hypothetical protein EMIHUDRAFT_204709 [Emiliania huxleyi CCMP1516]|uniref:Uncharacterized protein n=2 Tax=Emiliania huxleyi TaxID=2903 RepID=A0A0D3JW73_EMIH1|nr:hypothetical protein EMIHUDRAFT_204709 [Emiliania huxleyi CCMP1516]EOD27758.1 hypothetical protein EMIHUDRAFT_204709 [Emiliania huxleyi CCMP1516]|eukprot:XP_005780187.1 hypothetical protein EMIHUDRAFT_204709 [Emiliania huxleyi CCMP1516]